MAARIYVNEHYRKLVQDSTTASALLSSAMWNSPVNPSLKLTPNQVSGLLNIVWNISSRPDDIPSDRSIEFFIDEPVYGGIDPTIIAWESQKLMEQLTTDAPLPQGWPNALIDCILWRLVMDAVGTGIALQDCMHEIPENVEGYQDSLDDINKLRLVAGQEPLVDMSAAGLDAADETMTKLFFQHRNWFLGISEEYFSTYLRRPTDAEWIESHRRFALIFDWSLKSAEHLPAGWDE